MQLEKLEEIEENQKNEDEHIFKMWEPIKFEIKDNYKYINNGIIFKFFSLLLYIIVLPLLIIINKTLYGFKIYGKENLRIIKKGKITVSNHVHPMDCTMNALSVAPRSLYFPTLDTNFKIPVVRHIIRLLHAFPIPKKNNQKKYFLNAIYELLDKNKIVHFYPEASLWPYYKKLRKFKNGAFDIAVKKDVPIIPMVYKFVKPHGIWKLYKKKPLIELHILEPIYSNMDLKNKEAVNYLKEKVYNVMKEEIEK